MPVILIGQRPIKSLNDADNVKAMENLRENRPYTGIIQPQRTLSQGLLNFSEHFWRNERMMK